MQQMSLVERQIVTALLAVDGIGSKTFCQIQNYLAREERTWNEWWFDGERHWDQCRLSERQQHSLFEFQQHYTPEAYYGWLVQQGIEVILYEDEKYPILLKEIERKPIILFCKKPKTTWNQRPIGVVGTRKISGYGRQITARLTTQLVAEGASIVSGFMYGVDEFAHRAAIKAGGFTVGVLGYGFSHVYPQECRRLFDEVLASGGSFITEYAPHVPPSKGTFPQRNRIIAGMSEAVVVIEAGLKSGSHITVQRALDYGRNVCAVPGPITNPYSEGTKWLINQGAALVSSGKDIIETIGTLPKIKPTTVVQDKELYLPNPLQQQLFN